LFKFEKRFWRLKSILSFGEKYWEISDKWGRMKIVDIWAVDIVHLTLINFSNQLLVIWYIFSFEYLFWICDEIIKSSLLELSRRLKQFGQYLWININMLLMIKNCY
jgi:hypothetical protein